MAYQVLAGRFVGRSEELARLRELLARAVGGEPLVALIGGEAGVGKTRLAEQLAEIAGGQGVRVLRGGCVPLGEEGVPFAPVTEALGGLARDLDPAELEVVAGPARAELGRLVPDLAWGGEAAGGAAVAGGRLGRLCRGGEPRECIERPGGGGSSARPLVRYALTPRSRSPGRSHGRCHGSPPSRGRGLAGSPGWRNQRKRWAGC
jgi:AAA ATPase-like protein